MRTKYTEEDIEFLKKYYPTGDWDKIFERFPSLDKEKIYNVCHRRKISANYYERSKGLKSEQYQIVAKNRKKWTKSELDILKNNYSKMPIRSLLELLPDRSYDAVTAKAKKLSLISYIKQQQLYTQEDIGFIKANWGCMSDEEIAQKLGRTRRAIKATRCNLGLFRQDNDQCHYEDLTKFLRGQISQWKKKSIESCNYQCVLTGSKSFDVHHIISFNIIVRNFIYEYNIVLKDHFEDYNIAELNKISEQFIKYHDTYPLGVCVEKKLHMKFHSMYGDVNSKEQWENFVTKFKEGEILH